jgi:hypothetical protein
MGGQDGDSPMQDEQPVGAGAGGATPVESNLDMEDEEDSLPITQQAAVNKGKGRMPYDAEVSASNQALLDQMNADRLAEATERAQAALGGSGLPAPSPRRSSDRPTVQSAAPVSRTILGASRVNTDDFGSDDEDDEFGDIDLEDPEYNLREKKSKGWQHDHDAWRADARQVLCNIMEEDPEKLWSQRTLVREVERRVLDVAASYMNSLEGDFDALRNYTVAVLLRTPATFTPCERSAIGEREFRLNCGPGRLLSSAALQDFCATPDDAVRLLDPMSIPFALLCSVARDSGEFPLAETIEVLRERNAAQMDAFWLSFGTCTSKPTQIESFEEANPPLLAWTSYAFSGSSTYPLLSQNCAGQSGREGDKIREMLSKYNSLAEDLD